MTKYTTTPAPPPPRSLPPSIVSVYMYYMYICVFSWHDFFFLFVSNIDDYMQVLEREVNIDFCRSMNRIIFDKTVKEDPKTFAFVKVPEHTEEPVPSRGDCLSFSVLCLL